MASKLHLIRSASGLITFEAAGRHLNFTAAGKELGLSQSAVSLAIRRLEDQFDTKLFVRGPKRLELTEPGARFFADVTLGLSHIQKSAERLKGHGKDGHVTLVASTAFASLWLVPRLQRFREDLPDIELRLHTGDRDLDLAAEGIPLGVRIGDTDDWPDYGLLPIAPEAIYAVCSPSYLEKFGNPESLEDLLKHRLIHLEEPHRPACTWAEWFAAAGVDGRRTPEGLRINDYASVIQCAMEGQGIALGWAHLTDLLVQNGSLIRLPVFTHITGKSFNVAWPKSLEITGHVASVRDWLAAQGARHASNVGSQHSS